MLWRYTDMAIFVLRCFILTHPVHWGGYLRGWVTVWTQVKRHSMQSTT